MSGPGDRPATEEEIRAHYIEQGRGFFERIQTEADAWDFLPLLMQEISRVFRTMAERDGVRPQEAGAYSFATAAIASIVGVLRDRHIDGQFSDAIQEELVAKFATLMRERPLHTVRRRPEQ